MDVRSSAPRRKVTVGVCGGVAAYKAVELVRALQNAGMDPHVVMTAGAAEFVTPLTFAAVSGHRVITTLWSGGEVPGGAAGSSVEHIEQAQTTAALVIVPATANILGKLAHGIADDFLTTMYLAARVPVILAPSMNVEMWQHPAVEANVRLLRERSNVVLETGTGYLACGMVGSGRLAELSEIVAAVETALRTADVDQSLAHRTVLITAGGTQEPIDGVRFLGNRSSGRMGYALAEEAARRGARVILISAARGLTPPADVEVCAVTTAAEMHAAVLGRLGEAHLLIMAAAVADFRPRERFAGKLHRDGPLTLELEATEDVAADAVRHKPAGTRVIAFAAEIGVDLERGRAKMHRKDVDAIVINDVSREGIGFDSERNAATMLLRTGQGERLVEMPETSKALLAGQILDEAVRAWSDLSGGTVLSSE